MEYEHRFSIYRQKRKMKTGPALTEKSCHLANDSKLNVTIG